MNRAIRHCHPSPSTLLAFTCYKCACINMCVGMCLNECVEDCLCAVFIPRGREFVRARRTTRRQTLAVGQTARRASGCSAPKSQLPSVGRVPRANTRWTR